MVDFCGEGEEPLEIVHSILLAYSLILKIEAIYPLEILVTSI
jgi:hypothetical protein